jgi:hypothetical protein
VHDLSVEKVAVDAVSKIVHQAGKDYTFLLTVRERRLFSARLALLPKYIHLLVAEMCNSATVLKAIVGCAGKYIIVRA